MNSSSHHTAMNYGSRSALFKGKAKAEFLKYSREFFNTTKYVVGGGVDQHVAQPGGDPDW